MSCANLIMPPLLEREEIRCDGDEDGQEAGGWYWYPGIVLVARDDDVLEMPPGFPKAKETEVAPALDVPVVRNVAAHADVDWATVTAYAAMTPMEHAVASVYFVRSQISLLPGLGIPNTPVDHLVVYAGATRGVASHARVWDSVMLPAAVNAAKTTLTVIRGEGEQDEMWRRDNGYLRGGSAFREFSAVKVQGPVVRDAVDLSDAFSQTDLILTTTHCDYYFMQTWQDITGNHVPLVRLWDRPLPRVKKITVVLPLGVEDGARRVVQDLVHDFVWMHTSDTVVWAYENVIDRGAQLVAGYDFFDRLYFDMFSWSPGWWSNTTTCDWRDQRLCPIVVGVKAHTYGFPMPVGRSFVRGRAMGVAGHLNFRSDGELSSVIARVPWGHEYRGADYTALLRYLRDEVDPLSVSRQIRDAEPDNVYKWRGMVALREFVRCWERDPSLYSAAEELMANVAILRNSRYLDLASHWSITDANPQKNAADGRIDVSVGNSYKRGDSPLEGDDDAEPEFVSPEGRAALLRSV